MFSSAHATASPPGLRKSRRSPPRRRSSGESSFAPPAKSYGGLFRNRLALHDDPPKPQNGPTRGDTGKVVLTFDDNSRRVGVAFDKAVARYGDCHALTVRQQRIRWTWREFGERVDAFAAGLLALGFEPGDRVAIWGPNCAEWVVTQFATAKAGLILVNINPAYRLAELEYALNKVGCAGIVTATAFKTSDYVGMLNALAPELASAAPVRDGSNTGTVSVSISVPAGKKP